MKIRFKTIKSKKKFNKVVKKLSKYFSQGSFTIFEEKDDYLMIGQTPFHPINEKYYFKKPDKKTIKYMKEFEERIVLSPKKGKLFNQNEYKISIFIGFINNSFSLYIEDEGDLIIDAKYDKNEDFWNDVFKYINKYEIQEQC